MTCASCKRTIDVRTESSYSDRYGNNWCLDCGAKFR